MPAVGIIRPSLEQHYALAEEGSVGVLEARKPKRLCVCGVELEIDGVKSGDGLRKLRPLRNTHKRGCDPRLEKHG